jgi:hypothetical protein
MINLAKAKPNINYIHYNCLADIYLVAKWDIKEHHVRFFELHKSDPEWLGELKEETVFSLFTRSETKKELPFLQSENTNFWIVLNRRLNKEEYKSLKQKKLFPPVEEIIMIRKNKPKL